MRGTASLKAIAISLAMSSGQVTKAVTTAERQGCEGYIVISLVFSLAAAEAWETLTVSKKNSSGIVDGFGCCIAAPECEVYGPKFKATLQIMRQSRRLSGLRRSMFSTRRW